MSKQEIFEYYIKFLKDVFDFSDSVLMSQNFYFSKNTKTGKLN